MVNINSTTVTITRGDTLDALVELFLPDGSPYPGVMKAAPVAISPIFCRAAKSSGPAARWIAPSTPPPTTGRGFAVLTIASTCIFVISLRMMVNGMVFSFLKISFTHDSCPANCVS